MNSDLHLSGNATDNIWAMMHGDLIGLRLDCGDSGVVYLTIEQAREVIETLLGMPGMKP